MKKCLLIAFLFVATLLHAEKPRVMVSIPPQKWLVEQLTGEQVDVSVLLPQGSSPEMFQPTSTQIRELSRAKLWLRIGVPFEASLAKKLSDLEDLRIVEPPKELQLRYFADEEHHHHNGHCSHAHGHGSADPHVWLSTANMAILSKQAVKEINAILPDNAKLNEEREQQLQQLIENTRQGIAKELATHKGKAFFVFHPAFGYFADEFNLRQQAIETDGKKPTPKQLLSTIRSMKRSNVKTIFIQPQFDKSTARTIANAIGGQVATLDPLAEDWPANMRHISKALTKSF